MSQPLKQTQRTAHAAWCPSEAAPSLLAFGTASSASASDATLDFMSFDAGRTGADMDLKCSVRTEGGRRFSALSWGKLGHEAAFPLGCIAGGLQDGTVALWNPNIIFSSGADQGFVTTLQAHKGAVNRVEFHPLNNLMVTCGDSEVKIVNLENPSQPSTFEPSTSNKHVGSEVLSCAWNRVVPHILCSCSNTGTTVAVTSYPFKETAPHTKGVLAAAWNQMDPNLILSCGKAGHIVQSLLTTVRQRSEDNMVICTSLASGSPETWCEMPAQQYSFEVQWAPHKPALFSAASYSGTVGIYSVQQQQNAGKYCPRWYRKSCGSSFGFGGKLLSFGAKAAEAAKVPTSSFCHSLVVPSEPEIVPTADLFEHWIAERRLREYCHDKARRCGGVASHEGLMWELMGTQFEEDGRSKVPTLLGFDQDHILQEAERFLGSKPGNLTLSHEEIGVVLSSSRAV
eukprot:g15533.t1